MKKTFLIAVSVGWCLFFALHTTSQTPTDVTNPDLQKAQKLYQEGKYPEAETTLNRVVKTNPGDAVAWYYLGLTSLQQKDFKQATKAFEAAVKLQPDSARAVTGLANSYLLRNKLSQALPPAQRAVRLDPNFSEAHFILGVINFQLGDRDKALAEAEKAIELNKEFANAYLLKSQALVKFSGDAIVRQPEGPLPSGNRYREAAAALQTYLQLAPASADTQAWQDQMDSLNFHLSMGSKEDRERNNVYSSKDVTTKVRLISKPEPTYTDAARGNRVTGTVVLRALFSSDGTVKHIVVMSGLPDGLTWVSVRAAKKIKFVPATIDGQPVSMFINLEYNFRVF